MFSGVKSSIRSFNLLPYSSKNNVPLINQGDFEKIVLIKSMLISFQC